MLKQNDLEKVNGGFGPEEEKEFQVGDWVKIVTKSKIDPTINVRDTFRVREIEETEFYKHYYLDGYQYNFCSRGYRIYDAGPWNARELVPYHKPDWYEE